MVSSASTPLGNSITTLMLLASLHRQQVEVDTRIEECIGAFNEVIGEYRTGRHDLGTRDQAFRNLIQRAANVLRNRKLSSEQVLKELRRIGMEAYNVLCKHNDANKHQQFPTNLISKLGLHCF